MEDDKNKEGMFIYSTSSTECEVNATHKWQGYNAWCCSRHCQESVDKANNKKKKISKNDQ